MEQMSFQKIIDFESLKPWNLESLEQMPFETLKLRNQETPLRLNIPMQGQDNTKYFHLSRIIQ